MCARRTPSAAEEAPELLVLIRAPCAVRRRGNGSSRNVADLMLVLVIVVVDDDRQRRARPA